MTAPIRRFILDRVTRHARTQPDATAIIYGDVRTSYVELADRVRRLADDLARLDLATNTPVTVRLPRSPEQIVAMLALWQAGLTYLPVDPRDPPRRLEEIGQATGATVTIAAADSRSDPNHSLSVTATASHSQNAPSHLFGVDAAEAAYVIFTSGSTGEPKGVAASHESLSTLIEQLVSRYGLVPEDRVLQFAAPTFDTAIEQVGVALAAGAKLVLPETVWAPSEFHRMIVRARVTVMDLTPSYWREVVAASRVADLSRGYIRLVILGGAAVSNRDLKNARARHRRARIINAYGLTETGITSCIAEVTDTDGLDDGPAAIGHPLDGSAMTVLDASETSVGPGASGDVAVTGRLALGTTRGDGSLDPLPTVTVDGQRFYRTGDIGYIDPSRGLVVTGRADRQLKIEGFRVDPEEVENALRRHPGVRDCAVIGDPTGTTLYAFYTITPDKRGPGDGELLTSLRAVLPTYAVPSSAAALDALPQTRHGKTDYRALAEQIGSGVATPADTPVVLDSSIEHAVASVWTDVLEIDRDQLNLPFFDAGGTSNAAAELVARTRASLGIHVSYARAIIERLLEQPHFTDYCQAVAEARAGTLEAHANPRTVMAADLDRVITPPRASRADTPPQLTESSTILLTGATGFLGAHLLPRLLVSAPARVACLVRATSDEAARHRLRAAWRTYGSEPDVPEQALDRIDVVTGDLTQPCLGLDTAVFNRLADRTSLVIHSGGTVNFIYPYTEMKAANVDGTYELLRLAAAHGAPFHHVSTMAVIAGQGVAGNRRMNEDDPLDHLDQLGVGYAESKWVAEHLVQAAGRAGLPVAVYRAADISGHSTRGTWNTTTEMCCMKRFIRDIGAIPQAELPMDYTPVDVFADALVHIATQQPADGRVYHLTNPHKAPISLLGQRLRARGHDIGELSWDEWVARMIDLAVTTPDHPMTPFAPLFIDKCPSGQMSVAAMYLEGTFPDFTRTNVEHALAGTDITFPDVDADLIDRYLDFLEREEFL